MVRSDYKFLKEGKIICLYWDESRFLFSVLISYQIRTTIRVLSHTLSFVLVTLQPLLGQYGSFLSDSNAGARRDLVFSFVLAALGPVILL